MEANISQTPVREKLETYYKERSQRLELVKLDDVLSRDSSVFWFSESESAPEIVSRLIEKYLSRFEDWWSELTRDSEFCVKAIYLRPHVDTMRFHYETELDKAHTRITLEFINRFSTAEYKVDYSKLFRFHGSKRLTPSA